MTVSDPAPEQLQGQRVQSMVVTPVSVNASAADVSGSWKAWFVGRIGDRPKMFDETALDLKAEGGHFSFVVVGERPSSSGRPRYQFEGTIHRTEMKLTMIPEGESFPERSSVGLPMDGRKLQ